MSRIRLGLIALAVLLIALTVLHLGPTAFPLAKSHIVSACSLTNGSTLFKVAHRTRNYFDAYEVALLRLTPTGEVYRYYLGHEESYWWGASIRPSATPDRLEIRAWWQPYAEYDMRLDIVKLASGRPPLISSEKTTMSQAGLSLEDYSSFTPVPNPEPVPAVPRSR